MAKQQGHRSELRCLERGLTRWSTGPTPVGFASLCRPVTNNVKTQMTPPGDVVWLSDGIREFPHFVFSGDTDMSTDGLISLTARNCSELFLVRLLPIEARAGEFGGVMAAKRVMAQLRRTDLVPVSVLSVQPAPSLAGAPFSEFRRSYRAPTVKYSSLTGAGESVFVREESADAFVAGGGSVHVLES